MNHFTYNLMRLHGQLDEQIRRELKQHMPDGLKLLRLKRLRLRIKDRLHARMAKMQPA